jgi:DmsE family decaheme c-type cytochrome
MWPPRWTWFLAGIVALALATAWSASAGAAAAKKKPIDWVALNPAFAGATFVKDAETCRTCHEDAMNNYAATKHSHAFGARAPEQGECESCHGPRSKHIESPDRTFEIPASARNDAAVCLQCHEGGPRIGWKAGTHHSGDVGCSSCHTVMEKKSERALLSAPRDSDTCYTCHAGVRTDINKMSHHPVREGQMDCASCHNVHGATRGLLQRQTEAETCGKCHAEKRGPFVWEHAPVREACSTCHTPHGSNQRNLLTGKDPFLCMSCHSYGGHINLPRYNRVSNPYGSGCVNCHTSVHGSNHPSGAKLTR